MGMKIPGIGEVKPVYLYAGGGAVAAAVAYGFYKKRQTAAQGASTAAAAVADTSNQGNGSIDPVTGVPYADEGGVYGYGGIDPTTGVPYNYEDTAFLQYEEYGSQQQYSTNESWAEAAIEYAQSDLGATQALAQQSVADYLAQNPQGLPASEYDLMSELLALLGPPPIGSFKLHEATTTTTGGGGGGTTSLKTLAPGDVINVGVNIVKPNTMQAVATKYGISLQHLINNNPGSSAGTTGTVQVPYLVKSGDTLTSIASRFGISPEHLAEDLSTQGYV